MSVQPETGVNDDDTGEILNVRPGSDTKKSNSWVYGGNRLPIAPLSIDEGTTSRMLTSYYLQRVLDCSFGDCHRLLASYMPEMQLVRLIELKQIYKNGNFRPNLFEPIRQQQFSSIVGYLFAECEEGEFDPCKTCASSRSEGPFAKCIYDENGMFSGACANCQNKSGASNCSIRKDLEAMESRVKSSKAKQRSKARGNDSSSPVTPVTKPNKRARYTMGEFTPDQGLMDLSQDSPSQQTYALGQLGLHQAAQPRTSSYSNTVRSVQARSGSSWLKQTSTPALLSLRQEIDTELRTRPQYGL